MISSGSKKQSTLFQSWGKSASTSKPAPKIIKKEQPLEPEIVEIIDSDDDDLDKVFEDFSEDCDIEHAPNLPPNGPQASSSRTFGEPSGISRFPSTEVNEANKFSCQSTTAQPTLPGFDLDAGRTWIYPTNYPIREYQFQIVQKALYTNTMVVLPTGLGKTFIAAVIMYNFYRWYPQGKVIFMAPTRPLVAQQIEACFKIMGIPQVDTAIMTGTVDPGSRGTTWNSGRVFFLTPQVLSNDLSRGICPARNIRCLIVDEAHKALGNYAYCQVVQELSNYTDQFRIVALSATPGSDIKAVDQVLKNLLISHVELRSEDSPDIQPYTHQRAIDKVVVPLGPELQSFITSFLKVLSMYMERLSQQGAMGSRDPKGLSKFMVLKAKEAFCQNPPGNISKAQFGNIQSNFSLLISLCHAYELLLLHGARSFYRFLKGILDGEKSIPRARTELIHNQDFGELFDNLSEKFSNVNFSKNSLNTSRLSQLWNKEPVETGEPFVYGHPKLQKLEEIVVRHFENCKQEFGSQGYKDTRVMIFSQYRDSVEEIKEMLEHCRPLVRAMSFVGQGTTSGTSRGLTQKMQMKVVRAFKDGGFNTLVSTCVGEEGLDIGEVDLIVCYDAPKSPIRLVQRMGRTGRRRQGRIVVLLAEGKEEKMYNQSQYRKRSIDNAITSTKRCKGPMYQSPRMVPMHLNPVCQKVHITADKFKATSPKKRTNTRKPAITKTVKGGAKGEFLSAAELEHWKSNLRLPREEVAVLPPSRFLSIPQVDSTTQFPDKRGGAKVRNVEPQLSLSEWIPWQSSLQRAYLTGHSQRTQVFVDVMQMSQLQAHLAEDEDPYGHEMSAYLQQADVLLPGGLDVYGQENITSYFKPGAKPKENKVRDTLSKMNGVKRKLTDREDNNVRKIRKFDSAANANADMADLANQQEAGPSNVNVGSVRKSGTKNVCPWVDIEDSNDFMEDNDHLLKVQTSCRKLDLDDCDNDIKTPVKRERLKCSTSFLLIKSLVLDKNWKTFEPEILPFDILKCIATSNLYLPDTGAFSRVDNDSSLEFYEEEKEELVEFYEEKKEKLVNNTYEQEKKVSPNANTQVSPFNDYFDGECDIFESDFEDDVQEFDAKGSFETVKPSRNVPTIISPDKNASDVDLDSDSDLDIVLSGIKLESVIKHEDDNTDKLPNVVQSATPSLVPLVQMANTPKKILEDRNKPEAFLKLHNLKTSTPKTSFKVTPALPNDSPITTKGSMLNQKGQTTPEPLSTPVKRTIDVKNNESSSRPRRDRLNVSSVLFDNSSSVQFRTSGFNSKLSLVTDELRKSALMSGKSQDLLTVTQMVSLINKSHKEKCRTTQNMEVSKAPEQSAKTTAQDVPVFDLGFDFSCFDEDFEADSPGQQAKENVQSGGTNERLCQVQASPALDKSSKRVTFGEPCVVSAFNFGIDFDAFDESENNEILKETKETSCTLEKELPGMKTECDFNPDESGTSVRRIGNRLSSARQNSKLSCASSSRQMGEVSVSSPESSVVGPPVRRRLAVVDDSGSSSAWGSPPLFADHSIHRTVQKKKVRKKEGDGKCGFINEEAELSGFASSDDEDTSMDCYDNSFVDDHTHNSSRDDDVDMQALYLRSVLSQAVGQKSKFKLQYGANNDIDIFSQVPEEPMESYLEDSFCVKDDEVEYEESTGEEPETPEAKTNIKSRKNNNINEEGKKRKRILAMISSSEDETPGTPLKRKPANDSLPKWPDLNSATTSKAQVTASSSTTATLYTHLKTPEKALLPPMAIFDRSCERKLFPQSSSETRNPQPIPVLNLPPVSSEKQIIGKPDNVPLTVFVDTRELTGGQAVISMLRKAHSVQVIAQQLPGDADYQVGTQVGVLRVAPKALSQVQKKNKVVEKIQALLDFYDKPYLILESEKSSKKSPLSSGKLFRNRCMDNILFNLLHTDVKVLYSGNQGETAKMIVDLCQAEVSRGNGIHLGHCNSPHMQFYTSLPYVNVAVALNFCRKSSSISSFLKSNPKELECLGCISQHQALAIHTFIHSSFL